jgi:hypothetical protein
MDHPMNAEEYRVYRSTKARWCAVSFCVGAIAAFLLVILIAGGGYPNGL